MGEMNAANAISITLNGKPKDVPSESTVSDLLDMLELRERLVVVERNGAILNRSDFAQTSIERGDVLEIVHFVGGG